ncbi:amino acid permease [Methanofollis formosanus]|uniref:Amino acid permease n=1 Tax=Methanofollis formosanus TaxID=299308 RepID=A0A8G1EGQ8_9EURY|nr:APC family permease [Methanofollis formosanus]QYZ79439.1 amino acid permease [Methanofollis formosanus]
MNSGGGLRRELGLVEVTLTGVGIILGAGIYALLGEAAGLAGNAVWAAFGLSAVMASCTGLAYAELASMFPRASAEYAYVSEGFGGRAGFVIGWLILLSGVLSAATVALGFGGYIGEAIRFPALPTAVLLITGLSALSVRGIRETALSAIAMTMIEVGGIVAIVLIGLPHLGEVDYLEVPLGLPGVFQGAALVFFAYMGFEEMVKLAEETKNPEQTIPRAVLLALGIVVVLYMLVTLSAVSVMGWEGLAGSQAPFAEIAGAALGPNAFAALTIVALFATANTTLLLIVAASRLAYGMAAAGSFPAVLATIHQRFGTPWIAVAGVGAVAAAFTLAGEIAFVANLTNFALFLTFVLINATVIVLRVRRPDAPRPFRVPLAVGPVPVVPVLGILFSLFLLAQLETRVYLLGLLLAGAGVVLSYRWRARG